MTVTTIPSDTREYLGPYDVAGTSGGLAVDPTGTPPEFCAVPVGADPTGWVSGVWETDTTTDPDTYSAFVFVSGTGGGGTITLADGTYTLWLRVTHSPERPVRKVDTLIVT